MLQSCKFFGSLNEAIWAYFGQVAADLWVPKVWPGQDSNLGCPKSGDILHKLTNKVASTQEA